MKFCLVFGALLIWLSAAAMGQAGTLVARGVANINPSGTLHDANYQEDKCDDSVSGCESPPEFDPTNYADAEATDGALVDFFMSSGKQHITADPSVMNDCSGASAICEIVSPQGCFSSPVPVIELLNICFQGYCDILCLTLPAWNGNQRLV